MVVVHAVTGYRRGRRLPGTVRGPSRHRAHATVVIDVDTDVVLGHAQAEAPRDTVLAIQRQVWQRFAQVPDRSAPGRL